MDLAAQVLEVVKGRDGRLEGEEWRFQCPNASGHQNADRHPSARYHPEKRVWHCDVCTAGGGYKNLAKRFGMDVENGHVKKIVATYDYVDETGTPLFQVLRYDPKDFRQRRKVGSQWIWNLRGVPRVLYHLPEVLAAKERGAWIFLVEGEKDADSLTNLGITATTNPQGAKKWRREYSEALRGAKVALIPDRDEAGKAHADIVVKALQKVSSEIRVIELPSGKDVSEWLERGAGAGTWMLADLLEAAPSVGENAQWEPTWWNVSPASPDAQESASEDSEGQEEYQRTDLGNAKRLVAAHLEDIRYVHSWKKWLVWAGSHWQLDETGELERLMKAVTLEMLATAESDAEKTWAKKSQSRRAIHDALTLARSEAAVSLTSSQLDTGELRLNVANGTLALEQGTLEPHRREDLLTRVLPVAFDPAAKAPTWEAFLNRIMDGNTSLIEFLQRAVGYTLTASVSEQVLFLLHGTGANGKSTFLNVLLELLGAYAIQAAPDLLMAKRYQVHPTELADLFGRRMVVASEVESGRRLAEATVKQLTGGDKIRARRMREDFWQFSPTHKIWLAGNHKPVIYGTDHAIWRRIRLIPFTVTIPPEEQDSRLPEKLRLELPGILNWALAGCLVWRAGGLGVPDEVLSATASYRGEMDVTGSFLEDCCYLNNSTYTTTVKAVYETYVKWCEDGGEKPISKKRFNLQLEERGYTKDRGTANVLTWRGLGLRDGGENHE